RDGDPRLGYEPGQLGRDLADRADPVVHEEDLAVPEQLAPDGRGDLLLVVGADEGQHRVPLLGRGQDGGHLPDPGHAHFQRPRDGRGGHAEHVHLGAQPLEVLLVLDAEPLLLVDDHQAEPGEPGLRGQQLVRADDHVHGAVGQAALRARPLALAQSAPPRRCRVGASPPEYLVTSSSWSVGTYSRSGGWPRLPGAYSITRYSRVAPAAVREVISTYRPTPCCSC